MTDNVLVGNRPAEVPQSAWARGIGEPLENPGHPSVSYPMMDDGAFNGAPLGGMGAGSIGRTYRGDFARWHLDVGKHAYESLPACMFSVYMKQGDNSVTQALWTDHPKKDLQAWQWDYPVGAGTYYALYPRSWFVYERFPAQLSVEQFSPIIPHNYRESSYPVAVFEWTAHNPTDQPITIGVMFTWQNLLGKITGIDAAGGQINEIHQEGDIVGISMRHNDTKSTEKSGGSMTIATRQSSDVHVSYRSRFVINSDGADIWNDFSADGSLENVNDATPSAAGEILGAGIAITFTLQAGETKKVPFTLAWDMPVMSFEYPDSAWYKRYTAFYGREGNHAFDIARDGLQQYDSWRQQIIDWQRPILEDSARPDWYKLALFNELYFLADGATAWEHGRVGEPEPAADYIGGFLYIECFDYPHYTTFDVDFYGSFALLELFPEIEKRMMRDYVVTVEEEDLSTRPIVATGEIAPRKLRGAVPHDLGAPNESPWLMNNSYSFQDGNRWKDLNPKFVLRLYRNVVLLNDSAQLTPEVWEAVKLSMSYLNTMDRDGDGIPENEGIPDQTYDTWSVKGVSAYSASLWLAALAASREMARMVGDNDVVSSYDAQLEQATTVYEQRLWNGTYYDYDSSDSPYHDSIMADQLAGQWYMDFANIELLPADHVASALKTVYDFNVRRYGDGKMGAVNGMRPDGAIDMTDIQSQEMWTGTTYGLASFMLMRGLDEQAWGTAYGVYRVTYETSGLWFRTPEAFQLDGNYRASLYMRPLAIWAMETALRLRGR
jgi:non-lysosomal glucosylceramidase